MRKILSGLVFMCWAGFGAPLFYCESIGKPDGFHRERLTIHDSDDLEQQEPYPVYRYRLNEKGEEINEKLYWGFGWVRPSGFFLSLRKFSDPKLFIPGPTVYYKLLHGEVNGDKILAEYGDFYWDIEAPSKIFARYRCDPSFLSP